MPGRIEAFEARHREAVAAFNARLAAAGSDWRFPEEPAPSWLARVEGSPVCQQLFVVADGGAVRGGYALQRRPGAIGGEVEPLATWYLPISEGAIDRRFALVAMQIVRDALRRAPLSFCLGMNGVASPLAGLLARLGYAPRPVPFLVRVENGARFAREARRLRRRPAAAFLLDVAAATGAASLGASVLRRVLRRGAREDGAVTVEPVAQFGAFADALWQRARAHYSFVGLRDAAALNRIYPPGKPRVRRIHVRRGDTTLGWAVLQAARMSDNPHFGSLHVGRITDAFAAPEDAGAVVRAAADALRAEGVDVMLSNQSHPAWCAALRRNAFLSAPSNFAFAASPDLAKRLDALDPDGRRVHVNRGDGDGPWGHDPRAF